LSLLFKHESEPVPVSSESRSVSGNSSVCRHRADCEFFLTIPWI